MSNKKLNLNNILNELAPNTLRNTALVGGGLALVGTNTGRNILNHTSNVVTNAGKSLQNAATNVADAASASYLNHRLNSNPNGINTFSGTNVNRPTINQEPYKGPPITGDSNTKPIPVHHETPEVSSETPTTVLKTASNFINNQG